MSNEPKFLHHNTEIDGRLWVCGTGSKEASVMFIASNVLEEEAATEQELTRGKMISRTPKLLSSGHGVLFKKLALKQGLDLDRCWYTTIVKYLPENKAHRTRPLKTILQEGLPYLEKEIERIQPNIIVAVGKVAFDNLVDFRAKDTEIYGAWFYSKKYNAKIYCIPSILQVVKPEMYARFELDFKNIQSMESSSEKGGKLPINTRVVRNACELENLVLLLELTNSTVLSVDCEWEGKQHVDGKLRSLQIAWNETDAAYIRFMDDKYNYAFDVSYEEAGRILGKWCNRPEVRYIGHHVSADLMWMSHWLKLDWYRKAIFDTEFALQCCDESLDLGLDILALRYTDLGKYDWDLLWWRKQNPDKRGDGYGSVPDKIMIPYAIKDVITVYRAWGPISRWLERQGLTKYYDEILNPFVTDVFTFFGLKGIPIDKDRIDRMRVMYQWALRELKVDFQSLIAKEAETLLEKALEGAGALSTDEDRATLSRAKGLIQEGSIEQGRQLLMQAVGAAKWPQVSPAFEHYLIAPDFNIRSQPQMQRWLFDVKKYTPVKSTANKAAGMPSVDWAKIATYPPEKQQLFTPASDKGTLEILAARYDDDAIKALLELNAVGNICKAFLKEAEEDADGEWHEKGLHAYIATDVAIHLLHATTETGRPRSFNPNCLNWPSYISKRLQLGLSHIIAKRKEQGQLPKALAMYAEGEPFPTIRSSVMARPGWCIVEADSI